MIFSFGKRKAIKNYVKKLPALLKKDYGGSKKYTVEQVRKSVERHGLNEKHVIYAYAMFVDRGSFVDKVETDLAYDDLRQDIADNHFNGNLHCSIKDTSGAIYGGDDISGFNNE